MTAVACAANDAGVVPTMRVPDAGSRADFTAHCQLEVEADENPQSGLCCCEYYDRSDQRFHILGCCCNCEDFDLVFTNFITCRASDLNRRRGMLLTFQDRLRIPWRGGAKQISVETLLPIFVVPLMISIAAVNVYVCALMFVVGVGVIGYVHRCVQRAAVRTRFFSKWLFWSILYLVVLFEITVPLLELLPEENVVLVLFTAASVLLLYRTHERATMNHVVQSRVTEDELPDITEASTAEEEEAAAQTALLLEHDLDEASTSDVPHHQPNICASCRKYVPARTAHCSVCGACIMRRDHHSYWLDCCVGEWNHCDYLGGLVLALIALLLGADLTLTAVCHPFLVTRLLGVMLMLPDNCSEVFDLYEFGIAFVIAVYALVIAAYVLIILIRQIYLISRGVTLHECQRGQRGAKNKSFVHNWRSFLF